MDKVVELYVRGMNELEALATPRKGQGLVEYALILFLVSIAVIVMLTALGAQIGVMFTRVRTALGGA